jgi:ATP-dependent RNA helicase RhlE
VEQVVHPVARTRKRALLSHLIKEGDWRQVLVFTRTKRGASRLAKQLASDGVSATAIHGDKSQSARTRALADFKRGVVRTLVATDLASRGLDIDQLPRVVNFELPHVPEDYIHRIGRTGRAGAAGVALSMVCVDERKHLADIQKLLRREIQVKEVAGFRQEPAASASSNRPFQRQPEGTRKGGDFKRRPSRRRRARDAGYLP